MTDKKDEIVDDFHEAVNMTASELKKWLKTEDSRSVGMKKDGDTKDSPGGKEAVGHHMGERIVEILGAKKADLDDDDLADMKKVTGYVHRHSAQKPKGDVEDTRWRHSLMNWGNDPLK